MDLSRRSPIRCFVEWLRHRRKTSQNFFPLQLLVSCYYCVRLSWKSHDSAAFGRQGKSYYKFIFCEASGWTRKQCQLENKPRHLGIKIYFLCFFVLLLLNSQTKLRWIIKAWSIFTSNNNRACFSRWSFKIHKKKFGNKISDCFPSPYRSLSLKSEVIKKCASLRTLTRVKELVLGKQKIIPFFKVYLFF